MNAYRIARAIAKVVLTGTDTQKTRPDLTRNMLWACEHYGRISFGDAKLMELELDAIRALPEIEPQRMAA